MAATKTKRKNRKPRAIKCEQVEGPQQEVIEAEQVEQIVAETIEETPTNQTTKIDTVYLATRNGLEGYFGDDAQDLIKQIQQGDDSPYVHYETSGKPFYMAIQNDKIEPLKFPEPKDYGTTSADLFAMAITCADAIAEFVRLKIRGKQGLASQLMRPGILGMALVVAIFLIFILSVYIGGD
jgi:hypothetical protein